MAAFSFPVRLLKIHANPQPTAGGLELRLSTQDVTERFDSLFEGIDEVEKVVEDTRSRNHGGTSYNINGDVVRALIANAKTLRASIYDRVTHDDD